eukprot:4093696-Lingulodinium_polyedra.AAC.1
MGAPTTEGNGSEPDSEDDFPMATSLVSRLKKAPVLSKAPGASRSAAAAAKSASPAKAPVTRAS